MNEASRDLVRRLLLANLPPGAPVRVVLALNAGTVQIDYGAIATTRGVHH
jgi:hypothetical protein